MTLAVHSYARTNLRLGTYGASRRTQARRMLTRRASGRVHTANSTGEEATFIDTLSHKMQSLYGKKNCERIIESVKLNLSNREVVVHHVGKGEQRASSYISGLSANPYHDVHSGAFQWLEDLEANSEKIRDELQAALMNPDIDKLGNSIWVPAARDDAVAYGPNWRTLVLQDRCTWEDTNTRLFPETVQTLQRSSAPSVEVFFARQPPQTGIKPHTDNTNFILTAHLGLCVPEDAAWMQVGEHKKYWKNGKGLVADTSFIHSTANESETEDRYVLIVRFWHPDLTASERCALQFLFDALDDPSDYGINAAESRAKARLGSDKRKKNKKRSSHGGLGLLAKGMQ